MESENSPEGHVARHVPPVHVVVVVDVLQQTPSVSCDAQYELPAETVVFGLTQLVSFTQEQVPPVPQLLVQVFADPEDVTVNAAVHSVALSSVLSKKQEC